MDELIKRLKKDISIALQDNEPIDMTSWDCQCGILISVKEAMQLVKVMEYQQKESEVALPSDIVPNLFVTLCQQIHYESVIRNQDMRAITECFNELQDAYMQADVSGNEKARKNGN